MDTHFASSQALILAFGPILDKYVKNRKQDFSLNPTEEFAFSFVTNEGFQYGVNSSNVSVGFQHRAKARPSSGSRPTLELTSVLLSFNEMMAEVTKKIKEAALLVPFRGRRNYDRAGIVATTVVSLDDAPPGFINFLEYMAKPWAGTSDFFNIQITTELDETAHWKDRCVHTLQRNEDQEDGLMTINLDFQRTLKVGRSLTPGHVDETLTETSKTALSYFESLGIGSQFDEQLLRSA